MLSIIYLMRESNDVRGSVCRISIFIRFLFLQESASCITPLKKESFVYSSVADESTGSTSPGSVPGEFREKAKLTKVNSFTIRGKPQWGRILSSCSCLFKSYDSAALTTIENCPRKDELAALISKCIPDTADPLCTIRLLYLFTLRSAETAGSIVLLSL